MQSVIESNCNLATRAERREKSDSALTITYERLRDVLRYPQLLDRARSGQTYISSKAHVHTNYIATISHAIHQ